MSVDRPQGLKPDKPPLDTKPKYSIPGEDIEKGRTGRKSSKRRTLDYEYPNYKPHFALMLAHLIVFCLLFAVVFFDPSRETGIAKVASSDSYIGLMQVCNEKNCQGWMATGAPLTSGTPSTGSKPPSTPAPERRSAGALSHLSTRAEGDSLTSIISPADLFLTTGLAALAAFYLSFYTLFFLFIRRFWDPPRLPDESEHAKPTRRSKLDGIKVFAYRASRLFVFFEFWVVLGVAARASFLAWQVKSKLELSGIDGIGGGTAALHMAWVFLLYCWIMEWSAPKGRLHGILAPGCFGGGCGGIFSSCSCCCGSGDAGKKRPAKDEPPTWLEKEAMFEPPPKPGSRGGSGGGSGSLEGGGSSSIEKAAMKRKATGTFS